MIRRDRMPYDAGWEHFDWTQMRAQRVIPQMELQQPAVGNALIDALGKLLFFGVGAQADEADVLVSPFNDPVGRDAVAQWLGGVNMQLYWDTTLPSYPALKTIPENRVYDIARAGRFVYAQLSRIFARQSIERRSARALHRDWASVRCHPPNSNHIAIRPADRFRHRRASCVSVWAGNDRVRSR